MHRTQIPSHYWFIYKKFLSLKGNLYEGDRKADPEHWSCLF